MYISKRGEKLWKTCLAKDLLKFLLVYFSFVSIIIIILYFVCAK